jgi:hypothetical protein
MPHTTAPASKLASKLDAPDFLTPDFRIPDFRLPDFRLSELGIKTWHQDLHRNSHRSSTQLSQLASNRNGTSEPSQSSMKRGVLQNEFSSFELQPELDLT